MLPHLSRILLAIFAFAFLTGSAGAQTNPEFRAIWVDTWASGFKTAAEIDQLVLDAQRGNLNAIIPQVRRRADAFYNSTIEPKNTSVSPSSFDPLAYLIQKAHAANPRIEVHAWIVTYPVGSGSSHPDHVLNKHPDWLMESDTGAQLIGNEYWLDPAHPDVQQHTLDVAMDIIRRYDVDGFNFDYVRYPSPPWGYNPVSVARFNQRFGRSGKPSSSDPQWLQFRRDAVTELVRRVYLEAIDLKPAINISAATIGQAPGITTTSQWTGSAAYAARLQDWRAWMEEGILDTNMPMLYFNEQTHPDAWDRWNIFSKNHKYNRHLAIAPAWYHNTISDSFSQIQDTRQQTSSGNRADGVAGYNYNVTNNQSASRTTFLNALSSSSGPFPQDVPTPTMPWKSNPTHGHAKGIIIADNTPQPLEHALVTLTGPQNRTLRTDAHGFYGAVDLAPGTYTVTASMPNSAYDPADQQITITAGQVTTTDLTLVFAPAAEIIIDNIDAAFSGSWPTSTSTSQQYGSDYRVAWPVDPSSSPTSTAAYRPNISVPGTYDIYTWYVQGSNRSPNAPHLITHSAGETLIPVDQRTGGGGWQLLASDIHFNAGTTGYVRIANNADGDVVVADAVRFSLVEADPDPALFFQDPAVHAGSKVATVTWETVGPAVVRVEYGLSQLSTTLSPETSAVTTEHSVSLSDLQAGSQYHLRLHARAGTDTYASNWYSFETSESIEVILDNLNSGVSFAGAWSTGTFGAYYGDNYHRCFSSTAAGPTAIFRPTLPVSGIYDVYTWYPQGDSYSYDVPHLINHADGQNTVLVDQRTNGGNWRLLLSGRRFTAGTNGYVKITHPSTGHTIADAQRWVLRDSPPVHTLTTVAQGSGSISRYPSTATYAHGTTVQVTATPASGWVFSHWEGDIEGAQNPTSILLYRDRDVTAVFHQLFELTINLSGEGTVEIDPDQPNYPAETEVQVTAIPASGWIFLGWTGDMADEDNPALVWMDGPKTLTANFGFSYDAWSETVFTEAQLNDPAFSGPDADPYGHGIPNLLKFTFNMDLREPDRSRLPAVAVEGDRVTVSFQRLTSPAGIQYLVELSPDLATWQPANGFFTEKSVAPDSDGKTERVTLESDPGMLDGSRIFVRVRIE